MHTPASQHATPEVPGVSWPPGVALFFPGLVAVQLHENRKTHGDMPTWHHAWAVLKEELDEFADIVRIRAHKRNPAEALAELVDIAAAAQRAAEDLGLILQQSEVPCAPFLPTS